MNTTDIRPSQVALGYAGRLGRTMAMVEPRLLPITSEAHQYKTYVQFMLAHRHRLAQNPVFESWEAQIQKLIEREAEHTGLKLEDVRCWEIIERQIAIPLRCAFWFGWETVKQLKKRYDDAVARHLGGDDIVGLSDLAQSPVLQCNQVESADLIEEPAAPTSMEEVWARQDASEIPQSPNIHRALQGRAKAPTA